MSDSGAVSGFVGAIYARGARDGAATERERIRQLAVDHDAAITKDCECGPHPGRGRFADLLEGDSP